MKGNIAPTTDTVTTPPRIATTQPRENCFQSIAPSPGAEPVTKPKSNPKISIINPIIKPARTNPLLFRTLSVSNTQTNPTIRLVANKGTERSMLTSKDPQIEHKTVTNNA